jgi:iron complex outermembrane receptor protein
LGEHQLQTLNIRARLLATSGLAAALVAFAVPALAADPAPAPAASSSAEIGPSAVSEVVVTGTHIPKPNLQQPTPVEVIPQQVIVDSGTPQLGAVIAELPAMSGQGTVRSNANSFGTAGGLDFADLRNLGPNRTLVLVDGQRHVPGDPASEAVDLSSIPPALVDHIEVVTGGASAIYGSDALAGVVNIILKKEFTGLQVEGEAGALQQGAGQYYNIDFTAGTDFAGGKGNINITGLYDHEQSVVAGDIPALKNFGTIVNPADETAPGSNVPIPNDGKPDLIIVPFVQSPFISTTGVVVDPVTANIVTAFNPAGMPVAQQIETGFNSFAFGSFAGPCSTCFGTESFEDIIPRNNRAGGDLRLKYDLAPTLEFTLDAKYVRNEIFDFVQPSFTFFQDFLRPDNAFITPQLATQLAPVFALDQSFGLPGPFIDRFLSDLGDRSDDIVRQTYRVVGGFDGTLDMKFANVTWNATANFGTTRNNITETGDRISGNFEAALDSVIDPATGQPACRINVPSAQPAGFTPPTGLINGAACVPYNPFGSPNNKAAAAFISVPLHQFEAIDQSVADLNMSFDTSRFLNLPGGPIGFALGAEWRGESVKNIQDPLVVQGLTELAKTPNAFGSFNVAEGYIEANAPILRHQPFADEVSLDAAYRIAGYSTVGLVDAWKVSGVYGPFSDLKFRATYSKAVRAPNLTEAFLPPTGTFFTIADPCSVENIGSNANFARNCAAQGVPAGFVANANVSPPGVVSGNSALTPERSTSYTIGGVIQPHWLRNLAITVDYYNITITNAIIEPSAQSILNNCYASSAGLDAQFCNLFTRDPATHNITFITDTFENAEAIQTDGIEFQISYATDIAPLTEHMGFMRALDGRFSASLDVNWLNHLRVFPFQNNPTQVQISEGELGFPEWKGLLTASYAQGPWRVDWQTNFFSAIDRYNKSPGNEDPADQIFPLLVGTQIYDNLVLHYFLPNHFSKVDIYLGINDLLNAAPPPDVVQGNPGGPDGSAIYALGREIFGGVKAKF